MTEQALGVVSVSKHYDGAVALSDCTLSFERGRITALLGENGAGKSTLIKILTGVESPDEGQVVIDGRPVSLGSVKDGRSEGVVALYQETSTIQSMTVADNILLGDELPTRAGWVLRRETLRRARSALDLVGLDDISPRTLLRSLSPVQQTLIAMARALIVNAKVLILDEPTASLTDHEIQRMFTVLRQLRAQGTTVLYVSHRLEEVFELCENIVVMRNGRVVSERAVADSTIDGVVRDMVGIASGSIAPPRAGTAADTVLAVRGMSGYRVKQVDLDIRAGEILGIGGLAGSGRSELLRMLSGVQPRPPGSVTLDGRPLTARTVGRHLDAGIAYLPEERRSQALMLNQSIIENIALPSLRQASTWGFMSRSRERKMASDAIESVHIKARDGRQAVGKLSGGNQQKVALAKYLARKPRVLLLDEPTRGVDVGAKVEIYQIIRQLVQEGTAVVVVSSELPELIGLSDRIAVVCDGVVMAIVEAATTSEETLLTHCYGRTAA
ncbi:ribose ABC transporter ATP-binding protein RbsA [soil metagenome]